MAIYSKLSNIRRLTNSSLGSIIEVSNLNFNDLSLALLEFLNNVSYNETTNAIEGINNINVKQINVDNNLSVSLNGVTTFNIDSQGRAEGNSFLVEVAEAKRYRHTDFNNWPNVGIPGEIIYTGIQNQRPEFGEDFIGYLDGKGWVSLTDNGGALYALTLLQNTGSPGIPPTPSTGSGIVWIGDPGLATTYTPTTQDLYFTDENGEIFRLTCCDGGGGGGSTMTTKDMLWGLITNFAAGAVPEYVDWAGVLSPTGTHNSVLPIQFDLKIKSITLKYLDTTAASVDALFNYEVSIGKLIDPNGVADDTNYVDLTGGSNILTLNTANVDGNYFLLETSGLDIDVNEGDVLVVKGTVTAGSSTGGFNEEVMVSLEYEKTYPCCGGGAGNASYVETTNFIANVTKTITHGLGTNGVVVDLIDTVTGDRIDGDIDNYTTDSIDLTFTQDLASVRVVVVSAGGASSSGFGIYHTITSDLNIPENAMYIVWGDMEILPGITVNNDGRLIIVNGAFINGGTYNQGPTGEFELTSTSLSYTLNQGNTTYGNHLLWTDITNVWNPGDSTIAIDTEPDNVYVTKEWVKSTITNGKAVVTFTPGIAGSANTITHNLGTSDIIVQLWDATSGKVITTEISNATTTTVDITFLINPVGNVKAVIV